MINLEARYIPGEDPYAATARIARADTEFLDVLAGELARMEGYAEMFAGYDIVRPFYRERVLKRLDELARAGAN